MIFQQKELFFLPKENKYLFLGQVSKYEKKLSRILTIIFPPEFQKVNQFSYCYTEISIQYAS